MLDRRRFLIGAGGLLTAAFVSQATAFSRRVREPLILPLARKPEEALYIYQQDWSDVAKWRVSLGPDQCEAPPVPTWREYLGDEGYALDSKADIERTCLEASIPEDNLDDLLDGFGWQDRWDNFSGPQARAYHLLKNLDLGLPPNSKLKQAGNMIFEEFGGAPGFSYTWVELKDDLTVSLLQARLIELDLPIAITVGEAI
jgi:hypothetical protein